ncbi:hypothetical protein D3C84_1061580 [compost metagenome]
MGIGDGIAVATDLQDRVDFLTRQAVAGAEVAMVIDDTCQACTGEDFGEAVQVHFLDRGIAVGHDHGREGASASVRKVMPAAQSDAVVSLEFDVVSHSRGAPENQTE